MTKEMQAKIIAIPIDLLLYDKEAVEKNNASTMRSSVIRNIFLNCFIVILVFTIKNKNT